MLETQIHQVSSNELDKLFGEDILPTAEDLAISSQEQSPESDTEIVNTLESDGSIPLFDDSLLNEEDPKNEEVENTEDKVENEVEENKEETDETPENTDEDNKEDGDQPDEAAVNGVLKNTVEYLVKNNLWADWDGREDLEITQDVYAEIALQQAQHSAQSMFSELIDGTGDYGKAIISHIKNGGNPEEVIDIFKEQKNTDSIDTSTEEGKQNKIEQYYKDVLGWKPERVKKLVNRLVEDNEIESEFESVEESYQEHYKQKIQETQKKAEAVEQERREAQQRFVQSIKTALTDNTDLTEKEKREISSSILDLKHKLDNGKSVNDFYLKFSEMQQDPKEYIELVQFVTNKQLYKEKLKKKENSNASKEQFNFIKGNAAISKPKTANVEIEQNKDRTQKYKGTNFSFAIKK